MTHVYTYGNLYTFDKDAPIYAQIERALRIFERKHGEKPDLLFIHPDNIGDMQGTITAGNWTLQVIPDKRQSRKAFELARRGDGS